MENDEEMSKSRGMWIKIKEPMAERFPLRKMNSVCVLQGARKHHHLIFLIVILEKSPQSLKDNNTEGFCVIARRPNTAQNRI